MLLRQLLLILVYLTFLDSSVAQDNFWTPVDYQKLNLLRSHKLSLNVGSSNYYSLDKSSFISHINLAPYRNETLKSNLILNIPNQKGDLQSFKLFKTNTLSPLLAQKFPKINSYIGKSLDDSGSVLKLTTTGKGVFIMIIQPGVGQYFINPIDKAGQYYISFLKSKIEQTNQRQCDFDSLNSKANTKPYQEINNTSADVGFLRKYDLALACTGEYAKFQINNAGLNNASQQEQINAVLAAMTVTLDRINMIYERDLGVSMQLIPDNDLLIFLDPDNDPYSNNSVSTMLTENQTTLDDVLGQDAYDIGHVFGTGNGGVALLGSVCEDFIKAKGVTGSLSPVGDPFDVDFVAHEIGHQFGANHTQNNACQRNLSTAVEPGSASTIMGYAGICAPNIQNNSDAYFHYASINEIFNNISTGLNCPERVEYSNSAPHIASLKSYTIPLGTAFYLDVKASDTNNDVLTYNWEQLNNEISPQPPLSTSEQGPNFRSLPSKIESRRYFPSFQNVLNNNLEPTWEVIPTVARSMNFSVTVRDNNVLVGQSSTETTAITFADAGPFQVTSQHTEGINWLPGETKTITWEVAGTNTNGINTSHVNILLSVDGGENFDINLALNIPNDGQENIIVPALKSSSCRIMIEPVDNIYYALNEVEFSINTILSCDKFTNSNSVFIPDGKGENQPGEMATSTINISEDITSIDDVSINIKISHTWINDLLIQLKNPQGDYITLWDRNCNDQNGFNISFNENGDALEPPNSDCNTPLVGSFSPSDDALDLISLFSGGTQGDWTLEILDYWSLETGTLDLWEIEICSSTFSTEDNVLDSLVIFPNPNRGSFVVNLKQPLSQNSRLSIYDLQGRVIENIDIVLNSLTLEIDLKKQYQNGIYFLEILDQGKKTVQKLIINQ